MYGLDFKTAFPRKSVPTERLLGLLYEAPTRNPAYRDGPGDVERTGFQELRRRCRARVEEFLDSVDHMHNKKAKRNEENMRETHQERIKVNITSRSRWLKRSAALRIQKVIFTLHNCAVQRENKIKNTVKC